MKPQQSNLADSVSDKTKLELFDFLHFPNLESGQLKSSPFVALTFTQQNTKTAPVSQIANEAVKIFFNVATLSLYTTLNSKSSNVKVYCNSRSK